MIIGALTVIVWKQFGWLGLYEIIPGFIFGSIGIVVFSLLGKAPSAAMQKRFAEADAHYHSAPAVTVAGRVREGVLPEISRHNREAGRGQSVIALCVFLSKIFFTSSHHYHYIPLVFFLHRNDNRYHCDLLFFA